MMMELLTAVVLLFARPPGVGGGFAQLGLALLIGIWLSTWFIQVPQHRALSLGFASDIQHRLVQANWLRTVAWSFRALLVGWMVWQALTKPYLE